MGKDILKTPLARLLINKISYPHTKEETYYQFIRSIMRKYILETFLAGVLRTKIINSHTKGVKCQFNKPNVGRNSPSLNKIVVGTKNSQENIINKKVMFCNSSKAASQIILELPIDQISSPIIKNKV